MCARCGHVQEVLLAVLRRSTHETMPEPEGLRMNIILEDTCKAQTAGFMLISIPSRLRGIHGKRHTPSSTVFQTPDFGEDRASCADLIQMTHSIS